MTDCIYIFWSCKDAAEAKSIIHALLEQKLIACASILPQVESIYLWEEKIEESSEVKVILKTSIHLFAEIQKFIQKKCSYEVPEIIQVNIADGNPAYLSWLKESVQRL